MDSCNECNSTLNGVNECDFCNSYLHHVDYPLGLINARTILDYVTYNEINIQDKSFANMDYIARQISIYHMPDYKKILQTYFTNIPKENYDKYTCSHASKDLMTCMFCGKYATFRIDRYGNRIIEYKNKSELSKEEIEIMESTWKYDEVKDEIISDTHKVIYDDTQ